MPIEITLDEEDQLVQLDIKDLTLRGSAVLLTQGSKTNERVTIEAPLDKAIIQMKLGQINSINDVKIPELTI